MAGNYSISCIWNCLRLHVCLWDTIFMKAITPLQWHQKRQQVEMPFVAETILDLIREQGPIKITDLATAAEKERIGSRAHIYLNLTWLRDNEYVNVTNPNNNLRIKELSVSDKGLNYLELANG